MKQGACLALLCALTIGPVRGQTLEISEAYREAEANFPRLQEVMLQERALELHLGSLAADWLPAIQAGGQAVYHSTVASLPLTVPGMVIPEVPHSQFRFGLTVEQRVWDGGLSGAQARLAGVVAELSIQDARVAAYGLRTLVEDAYFGALEAGVHLAALSTFAEELESRLRQVEVARSQGAATASGEAVLKAELLRLEQQRIQAQGAERGARAVLSALMGREVHPGIALLAPNGLGPDGQRPEELIFSLNRDRLEREADLVSRRNRPRIQAFGDVAAGRPPGLDLFEDSVEPFFSAGLRIQWPVFDGRKAVRDLERIRVESEVVDAREAAFRQSLQVADARLESRIAAIEEALVRDDEIIALRTVVAREAATRMENGAATATDYLTERNAEHRARLDAELRRISLWKARAQRHTLRGAQ